MKEAKWLAARDPEVLLEFLKGKVSDRKLRLFACACFRSLVELLPEEWYEEAIALTERVADGAMPKRQLQQLRAAFKAGRGSPTWSQTVQWAVFALGRMLQPRAWHAAAEAVGRTIDTLVGATAEGQEHTKAGQAAKRVVKDKEYCSHCDLLRDVFGNPFRPTPHIDRRWLAWNDGTVRRLAEAAYQEREMPSGHLDQARIAILADALEEAGCTEPVLLGHCRNGGAVHVRGCWAVDLLTGRE
jgi:hypothetical protein